MADTLANPAATKTAQRHWWRPPTGVVMILALVLSAALGWFAGSRWADGSDAAPAANTELVAEWTDAVRDRDPQRISDLYTDDAVWFDEAGDEEFTGRAGVQSAWNIFGYVDDVVEVDVLAVSADRAVIRWDFAISSAMETVGISVLEFNDGQISAETVYYDSAQAP